MSVIGLGISSVIFALVAGLTLLLVWMRIGFDKQRYADNVQPVDGTVSFFIIHGETDLQLVFRTLDWDCQPDEAAGSGYVCLLDFEVRSRNLGFWADDSPNDQQPAVSTIGTKASSSDSQQWPTINSLDQWVVDRCYRPSQGGPFSRSEGCSSPQHEYIGYADRERKYEAWDLGYRAKDGTCLDQPISPDTSIVCQSRFWTPVRPDFASYHYQREIFGRGSGIFLPGAEMPPATKTPAP